MNKLLAILVLLVSACTPQAKLISKPINMSETELRQVDAICVANATTTTVGNPIGLTAQDNRLSGGFEGGFASGISRGVAASAAMPRQIFSAPHYRGCMAEHGVIVEY